MTTKAKNLIMTAALSVALILGCVVAAYAAETPADEAPYGQTTGQSSAVATVSMEGVLIPATDVAPKDDPPPETETKTEPKPGGDSKKDEKPNGDKKTESKDAADGKTKTGGSGSASNEPAEADLAQYPGSGTSSAPGEKARQVSPEPSGDGDTKGAYEIGREEVPQTSKNGDEDTSFFARSKTAWSLFDAVMAAVSVIAAFICALMFVTRRKDEDAQDAQSAGRGKKPLLFALSVLAAAPSVALFVFTQDVTTHMEVFDSKSPYFSVFAAIGVIAARLMLAKPKTAKEI